MDRRQDRRRKLLEALVEQHAQAVAQFVGRRISADLVPDLVQETFLAAWKAMERLPADTRPWLLAVARRRVIDQLRRAPASELVAATDLELRSSTDLAADVCGTEWIRHALSKVSDSDRELLVLVAWDGLSVGEAATVLGISNATLSVRLHRARARFRALLQSSLDEPEEQRDLAQEGRVPQ